MALSKECADRAIIDAINRRDTSVGTSLGTDARCVRLARVLMGTSVRIMGMRMAVAVRVPGKLAMSTMIGSRQQMEPLAGARNQPESYEQEPGN